MPIMALSGGNQVRKVRACFRVMRSMPLMPFDIPCKVISG